MQKLLCIFLMILVFVQSFSSCNNKTNSEQINNTLHEALNAINHKDYSRMQSLMGIYSPSDTSMEDIVSKVNRVDYFIDNYFKGDIRNLTLQYSKELDGLSRMKITVPLFKGYDSLTGIIEASLYLYVGPPTPVPLSKLSGFDFDAKLDMARREQLDLEGKLLDFDSPQ